MDYSLYEGSQESLYSPHGYRIFTPPATKPKNNIFFSSDDSLFKSERRKFTIPRIEIETDEPIFNLQVTDFSDPSPKNVTLTYDETGIIMQPEKVEEFCMKPKSWKDKTTNFAQQKSYSIETNNSSCNISEIHDTDKFLSISARKLRQQRLASSSLQDLSSSTSSINSGVHESNLDLSQIYPDSPIRHKNWRSPYEIRHGNVRDVSKQFENKATSVPMLNKRVFITSRSKSVSEEKLNDKLTEYERMEILKLLYDWSLNGSESKSEFNIQLLSEYEDKLEAFQKTYPRKQVVKFSSEPDLSPKTEKTNLVKTKSMDQFCHKCEYRNCIFNIDFGTKAEGLKTSESNPRPKPKGILKTNKDVDCLNNITNLQRKPKYRRRYSEIIEVTKPFNSTLVRCDSLERLNDMQKKKFPDSYIVTRRNSGRKSKTNENNNIKSPRVVVARRKCLPKTWKSCSDIKCKNTIRKCCRNAKKSCPVSKTYSDSPRATRKAQSCVSFENEELDATAARLAALRSLQVGAYDRKITIDCRARVLSSFNFF